MVPEDFSSENNFDVYAAFVLTDKDLLNKLLKLFRSDDQIDPVVKELIADALEREEGDKKSVEPRIEIKNIGQRKRANTSYQLNLSRQRAEVGRQIQKLMTEKGWGQGRAISEILQSDRDTLLNDCGHKESKDTYEKCHRYYKQMIEWIAHDRNRPFNEQRPPDLGWKNSPTAEKDFHMWVGLQAS